MITLIRIAGLVTMNKSCEETLRRLHLKTKFSCILLNETPSNLGMLKDIKDFVAFGKIDEKTLADLIKARGKVIGDTKAKVKDAEKVAKEVMAGKKLEELGVRPWFGLHPARGGIDSKHHYPKGVMGNHGDKLNKLIERML